jgi:hypothetical protein
MPETPMDPEGWNAGDCLLRSELPPIEREALVMVSFAPTRTMIGEVTTPSGAQLERHAKRAGIRVVKLADLKQLSKVVAKWRGETPRVKAAKAVASGTEAENEAAIAAFIDEDDKEHLELLEDRANRHFADHQEERRFFFQFDAWSSPRILACLAEEGFRNALSPAARRLFVDPQVALPFEDPDGFHNVTTRLIDRASSRAFKLIAADRLPTPFPDPAIVFPPSGVGDHKEAMRRAARYVAAIAEQHFPGLGALEVAASQAFERAFVLFATGNLAFVPTDVEDGVFEELNSEPDSGFFFLFAELALGAIVVDEPHADCWFALARLFVACEDAFMALYDAPAQDRLRLVSYVRERRGSKPPQPVPEVLAQVARFKARFNDRATTLDKLSLTHSINLCHALRDAVV